MPSKPSTTKATPATDTPNATKASRGASVNRVTLVGRLVADPELRTTGSGLSVTTVRIATNDREQPEFHNVVLWRQQAEFAAGYVTKGRLVYIEGRLQARTWEAADGSKRRMVEVVADRFQTLTSQAASGGPA